MTRKKKLLMGLDVIGITTVLFIVLYIFTSDSTFSGLAWIGFILFLFTLILYIKPHEDA